MKVQSLPRLYCLLFSSQSLPSNSRWSRNLASLSLPYDCTTVAAVSDAALLFLAKQQDDLALPILINGTLLFRRLLAFLGLLYPYLY
jgi:hypothetical protein